MSTLKFFEKYHHITDVLHGTLSEEVILYLDAFLKWFFIEPSIVIVTLSVHFNYKGSSEPEPNIPVGC